MINEGSISCSVKGCTQKAYAEVILYDVYTNWGEVFFEQDFTCPYICIDHLIENEGHVTKREFRSYCTGPYTNRCKAAGFTIYRPLVQ